MKKIIQKSKMIAMQISKSFDLKDLQKRFNKRKNLYEILSCYPNKGVGFKVWQKDWLNDQYYIITHVDDSKVEKVTIWGNLYYGAEKSNNAPVVIDQIDRIDLWNHEVRDFEITLNNGVSYNIEDYRKFKQFKFPKEKY